MTDVYLGDSGITFNIDTESTMTSLTSGHIDLLLPDGALETIAVTTHASQETYLTFTVTSTISMFTSTQPAGDWTGQAHVVLGAASSITLHGAPFIIKVGEPL